MDKLIWGFIREVRPRQWIKNTFLFAGLIFSGLLNNPTDLFLVTAGFVVFSGLASAVYLINDVFDIERDRQHPFKKFRPIAAGTIPVWLAITVALALVTILLPIAYQLS